MNVHYFFYRNRKILSKVFQMDILYITFNPISVLSELIIRYLSYLIINTHIECLLFCIEIVKFFRKWFKYNLNLILQVFDLKFLRVSFIIFISYFIFQLKGYVKEEFQPKSHKHLKVAINIWKETKLLNKKFNCKI